MKPITVWEKYNKEKGKWCHNHIENGHVPLTQEKPIGTSPQTKIWKKGEWRFNHKHLNNNFKII